MQWLQIVGCLLSDMLWCKTIARSSVTSADDHLPRRDKARNITAQKPLRLENTDIPAKEEGFKSASQHEMCLILFLDLIWLAGEWAEGVPCAHQLKYQHRSILKSVPFLIIFLAACPVSSQDLLTAGFPEAPWIPGKKHYPKRCATLPGSASIYFLCWSCHLFPSSSR